MQRARASEGSVEPMDRLWPHALAGLTNNLNDAIVWGLLPIVLASRHIELGSIATIVAIYPIVWGILQFISGMVADRIGTRTLVVFGMLTQALALVLIGIGNEISLFSLASILLGIGTAMSYPALLLAVGNESKPRNRSRQFGRYRFWRDMGFVAGAGLMSIASPMIGVEWIFIGVAALTALTGLIYRTAQH